LLIGGISSAASPLYASSTRPIISALLPIEFNFGFNFAIAAPILVNQTVRGALNLVKLRAMFQQIR